MHRDDDAEIIAAARVGFLDEATDLLLQFEQALLVMETTPDDDETLNAAFRAAHTIKGTAGLFGCDAVVLFTHEVETLMEALRSGQTGVTEAISAALLEGLDQRAALLDAVRSGETSALVHARSLALGERLRRLHGAGAAHPTHYRPWTFLLPRTARRQCSTQLPPLSLRGLPVWVKPNLFTFVVAIVNRSDWIVNVRVHGSRGSFAA